MLYLQSFVALSLVLGLLWVLYRLAQRFGGRIPGFAKPRRIQVMERSSLGDRRSLLLVSVAGQQFLVGSTPQNLSLLAKIEMQEAVGEETAREKRENEFAKFREDLSRPFAGDSDRPFQTFLEESAL